MKQSSIVFAAAVFLLGGSAQAQNNPGTENPAAATAKVSREEFTQMLKKAGPWNRKPTNEAKLKREIAGFFKGETEMVKKADFERQLSRMDFPVYLVSDDTKGQPVSVLMNRDSYAGQFKPFFQKAPRVAEASHKPNIMLLSDTLAAVTADYTMNVGGHKLVGRFSGVLVKRGDRWLWKVIAQAGGDGTCGGLLMDKVSNPSPEVISH